MAATTDLVAILPPSDHARSDLGLVPKMNADGIQARIDRLSQLIDGLARETAWLRKGGFQSLGPAASSHLLAYQHHLEDAVLRLNYARTSLAGAHHELVQAQGSESHRTH